MRFLMLNWRDLDNPKAGGAERVTQRFLSGLADRGHEVFWFTQEFPGCSPTSQREGVTIIRGGYSIAGRTFKVLKWYRQQPHFDLVIDQHHGVPWYAPWWCKTNCIAYIHEVLGPIWSSFFKGWKAPVAFAGKRQERATLWFYRNVPFWTICESTASALKEIGIRNVREIPNGVHTIPLDHLEPKPLEPPLRLVFVSRLAPNKRIDHAILATRILRQRGIQATLQIAGNGDSKHDLERFVSELQMGDAVQFLGFLTEEEKNQMLQNAHFLLHSSVREGWGLNVIEANAMGTPAVVYPTPGLVDSTLKNITGLVSDAETPASLAASILSILGKQGEYDRIRHAAWERSKTFHWSHVLPIACDWLESQAKPMLKH